MKIRPARRIRGQLSLPGDKSISHRAAILAAIARGRARLTNFSTSEDCASTLACLRQLGAKIEREGTEVIIEGAGLSGLRAPAGPLDCGNSGSTMRMLAGVLAGQGFDSTLTGDASLCSRPMKRIIEPLELMGARVAARMGRAPLRISGGRRLEAISYEMLIPSAQVKSCLLLAGLFSRGRTEVIEERGSTRDHTERLLRWLGVEVQRRIIEREGGARAEAISIEGGAQPRARGGRVPGDISSAAFFIAAAALLPGSELIINGVGLNRTRTRLIPVLRSLGAHVELDAEQERSGARQAEDFNEPLGDIRVTGRENLASVLPLESNNLRGALIPQLIDELPVLAVVGSQVEGGISIRDARELRVKESDRIKATVRNLRAMGVTVEEHEDGLTVRGPARLRGARLDAHNDHRIAMAFTIAALLATGESEIVGAECARVSLPEFFELLESVTER